MKILGAYDEAVPPGEQELALVVAGSLPEAELLRGEARYELTQHESPVQGWTCPWEGPYCPQDARMSRTVLVADDDEQVRYVATAALARKGYDVIQASDGVSALELLKAHPIDLLVTNVAMPRMAGLELVQAVWRTIRADLPVVVMTGHSDLGIPQEIAERVRVLRKPFEPSALQQAADVALGGTADRDSV